MKTSLAHWVKAYFKELVEQFGMKMVLMQMSMSIGVRGIIRTFGQNVALPFYKQGLWSGNELQISNAIAFTPWSMQAFCGLLSDVLPFFGFYRSAYFGLYTLCGTAAILTFILKSMTVHNTSAVVPSLLFMLIELNVAFCDVLNIGKYTTIMLKLERNNGNIVTFAFFCVTIGSIFPAFAVGPMADTISVRYIFLLFLPFAVQPFVFLYFGCMVDDKCPNHKNNRLDLAKLRTNWKASVLAVVVASAGIISVFVGIIFELNTQIIYFLITGLLVLAFAYLLLPLTVANVTSFVLLAQASYIHINGALEYYFTGDELCVPGGPQFSYLYYKTYVAIMSIVAQAIGCIVFQAVFTKWKFRSIIWVSTFIKCLASMFDLVIVNRWNLAIGIPDKVMYLLGTAMIYEMTEVMDIIPSQLIIARLAPRNVEGTLVAIACSYANYGSTINRYLGAFTMKELNIVALAQGPGCDFTNLGTLIIVTHFVSPMCVAFLAFIMIPDVYVTDQFADREFARNRYLLDYMKLNNKNNNNNNSMEMEQDKPQVGSIV